MRRVTPEREIMCWALLGLGVYVGKFQSDEVRLRKPAKVLKLEEVLEIIFLYFCSKTVFAHWKMMHSLFHAAAFTCSHDPRLKSLECQFVELSQLALTHYQHLIHPHALELRPHCEQLSISRQELLLLDAIFSMGLLIGINGATDITTSVANQKFSLRQVFEAFSETIVRRMYLPLTINASIFALTVFTEAERTIHLRMKDTALADALKSLIGASAEAVLAVTNSSP